MTHCTPREARWWRNLREARHSTVSTSQHRLPVQIALCVEEVVRQLFDRGGEDSDMVGSVRSGIVGGHQLDQVLPDTVAGNVVNTGEEGRESIPALVAPHGVFLVAVRGRQVENERVYGGCCQGQVAVTGGVPTLGCSFRVSMAVGEDVGVDRRARSKKRQTVPFRGPAQTRHRRAECLGPRRIPRRRSASPPAHPESRPANVWPGWDEL